MTGISGYRHIGKNLFVLCSIVGVLIAGCGGGGGSSAPASKTLSGTVAVGAPIVGANINIICAAGSPVPPTTTNSSGAWQVTLTDQTLPCAVQGSGGTINDIANTTNYHSIAISLGIVNISPLTDLMVANLVAAANPTTWFSGLSANPTALATIKQADVDATLALMRTALSGLTPLSTLNPITTAFTPANGNSSDDMLTALAAAMTSASITYPTLLSSASQSSFTAPTGFNTAVTIAWSNTTSGGTTSGAAISATANVTAQNLTVGTTMTGFSPLTPSGGTTPYTFSYTGTLPSGLSFDASTGVVTGTTDTTYATASLVFSVKDSNNVVASTTSTVSFSVGAATGGGGGVAVGTQMGGARQGVVINIAAGSGVVSTFAGDSSFGSSDGSGTAASFYAPSGITTDGINLYVAEKWNNTIRKVAISSGQVTTLAGSRWVTAASIDGVGTAASFNQPTSITTDGTNLFVVDSMTNKIRKIVIATGVVTTLAGSGSAGSTDGIGAAASFGYPGGLTTDGTNLYVADTYNYKIRKIVIATGQVTTLAGSGTTGSTDGIGTAALFTQPSSITTDGINLYVGDNNSLGFKLRQIVLGTGAVTTMGSSFGIFNSITTDGTNLYVTGSGSVKTIAIATLTASTLAGGTPCGGGYACGFGLDGTGAAAKFNITDGITTDGLNLYVTDRNGYYGNFIRKIQ